MNITINQEAVEFYSDNRERVEAFGILNVLDDREDRLFYNKGKKAFAELLKYKNNQRIVLTEEEILPVFEEYLRSYDQTGQVKTFDRNLAKVGMSASRNDRTASAMAVHGQIVFCDTWNDSIVKSFDRMGNTLKDILRQYNIDNGVNRFNV